MNIYDELTDELIESEPDLTTGYIYKGKRISVHHDAVDPVIKIDILPGAESCNDGNGLRGPIEVSSRTSAWDEYEDCMYYHRYTDEELSYFKPITNGVTWEELAKAYNEGVMLVGK